MKVSRSMRCTLPSVLLVSAAAALPALAAGFGIFEQGSKATGMANAFTAQADDPSAMFYNAGGLAFLEQRDFLAGATLIFLGSSEFSGAAPFPGPTQTGNQVDQVAIPIHFYWVEPITDRLNFGLGVGAPFGLITEWDDSAIWSGQFISVRADLEALDLNPSIGWQLTDSFGVGAGLVVRGSRVELERNIPTVIPYPMGPAVGSIGGLSLESDFDSGFGFNLGLLHKITPKLSWGLSYRSAIEIDYAGDATFTQSSIDCTQDPDIFNPNLPQFCIDFDNIVSGSLPFGEKLPIETSIEFPDMASLGIAYRISPKFLVEGDFNWTGWSSFDTTEITFTDDPQFSTTIVSEWDDVMNYRFGLLWDVRGPSEWRFGAYFDETPQPEQSVGPLLPDADRRGLSVGYGRPINNKTHFDMALMWVHFAERTTTNNLDGFYGTYQSEVWLVGASIGF